MVLRLKLEDSITRPLLPDHRIAETPWLGLMSSILSKRWSHSRVYHKGCEPESRRECARDALKPLVTI